MKKNLILMLIACSATLGISACGGGGGGGGGGTTVTGSVTKAYLFGNMSTPASFGNLSSSGRIATVHTTITVPSGILINYSSAPGATTGLYPLRTGTIVPSGPVKVATNAFSGSTYDIASRMLTINMVNTGRALLKSSSTGNGTEFATLKFSLATPGVTPPAMPSQDSTASISEELPDFSTAFLPGRFVKFSTTFQ